MKSISTTFDTNRIVTLKIGRQTHRPVTAPQKRQGRSRRRDLPANRFCQTGDESTSAGRRAARKPR